MLLTRGWQNSIYRSLTLYSCNFIGRVVSESESLFTYDIGQSLETYMDTAFVPVFDPLQLPFYNMPGAAEVCGDSLECLFDIGSTGLLSVGNITMEAQTDFSVTLDLSEPGKVHHFMCT